MAIGIVLCTMQVAVMAAAPAAATGPDLSGLVSALASPHEPTRLEAIDELTALGPKAAPAVDALARELSDPSASVRAHAAKALGRIGAPALASIDTLLAALQDQDPLVRWAAVQAVAALRPSPDVALAPLVRRLNDPDRSVRLRAVAAIATFGEDAVGPLVAELHDNDAAYWACLTLERLGPEAKRAAPALVNLLDYAGADLRQQAILALAAIGPAAASAAGRRIVQALDDPAVRVAATYALVTLGLVSPEAEAKIRANAATRNDPLTKIMSLWALAKLHPQQSAILEQATAAFVEGLKSDREPVRAAAARAIREIRPGPGVMVPLLEKTLQEADPQTVRQAMDALAAAGPAILPALVQGLNSATIRADIAYAIGRMGPQAAPAVGALAGLLGDRDPKARREAALALAMIGPKSQQALPALIRAIHDGGNNPEYGPVYALGSIGPAAIAAKPVLLKSLTSTDSTLALLSAWALAGIDPGDAEVAKISVPLLQSGLSYPQDGVRQQSAMALGRLGPLAKSAIPVLAHTTEDRNPQVGEAAGEALKAIGGYRLSGRPPRGHYGKGDKDNTERAIWRR